MLIRQETSKDDHAVYQLVKEAFATAERSDGNEQDLVVALRKSTAFVPELSLVAEIDHKIVGYLLFTEAAVANETVLVAAPLAVLPEMQKQGVGAGLIREGHKIAQALGYQYSVVVGSEQYYPRFGYLPAETFGIDAYDGIPGANFMAIKLQETPKPLRGALIFAKEFGL